MSQSSRQRWCVPAWIVGLALAVALPGVAQEAQPPEKVPAPVAAKDNQQSLTLADCIGIAGEKQPALAAYRASLASAQTAAQALDDLRCVANLVTPDLAIRREQACLGIAIAEAVLHQAELDNAAAVTRLYFTVQYARAQRDLADEAIENFEFYQKTVSEGVKKPKAPKEWTTGTVDKLTVYLQLARSKRAEAQAGIDRALAALREAMGMCSDSALALSVEPLPQPDVQVDRKAVVASARAVRGEVIQSAKAAEIFNLEVCAQGKHHMTGVERTFAAGGDIHAQPVPTALNDKEYRPGAIAPEMPTFLAGSRCLREQRAQDLANRAAAVAEKVEKLVVLEAEDTFARWHQAAQQAKDLKDAAESGTRLARTTREDFRGGQQVKVEDVLANEVLSSQARSSFNEALLNQLITLAGLERISGGCFSAGLAKLPAKR